MSDITTIDLQHNSREFWDIWNSWVKRRNTQETQLHFSPWLISCGCNVITYGTSSISRIEFPSEQSYLAFKLKYL
jgi:hypothetical protein